MTHHKNPACRESADVTSLVFIDRFHKGRTSVHSATHWYTGHFMFGRVAAAPIAEVFLKPGGPNETPAPSVAYHWTAESLRGSGIGMCFPILFNMRPV